MQTTSRLGINVKTIDLLHNGDLDAALQLLIGQLDDGLLSIAMRPKGSLFETNTVPIFRYAVTYRQTNHWIEKYELPGSEITDKLRDVLQNLDK